MSLSKKELHYLYYGGGHNKIKKEQLQQYVQNYKYGNTSIWDKMIASNIEGATYVTEKKKPSVNPPVTAKEWYIENYFYKIEDLADVENWRRSSRYLDYDLTPKPKPKISDFI